jgi:hypothetical protein
MLDKSNSYICSLCGETHYGYPLDFAFSRPFQWYQIPENERASRIWTNDDLCVIDQSNFYIRVCLEIPVIDSQTSFAWGVWVLVSKNDFKHYFELWAVDDTSTEPPFDGFLNNRLAGYPDTLNLKTKIYLRSNGLRPVLELEQSEHPIVLEQRQGITMERVQAIAELLLHN